MIPTRVLEGTRQFAFYQKWEDFPENPHVICPIRLRARVRRLAVSVSLTSILGESGRFDNIAASLCVSEPAVGVGLSRDPTHFVGVRVTAGCIS